MISDVLLQRYLIDSAPLVETLDSQPALVGFLKRRATDEQAASSSPLLSDPRLVAIVEEHPEIVPYLQRPVVQTAVDPRALAPQFQQLLGANPALMDLLAPRPRLIQTIFRVEAAGGERQETDSLGLYRSLVAKVDEFNERLAKGNRLPRFTIALNRRSGQREIDVTLSDGPPVTFDDALASLETALAEAFLGYSRDPIARGYLAAPIAYTMQRRGEEQSFSTSGLKVLFGGLTMSSYPLFRYMLWLLSRRADIEVGQSLDSIRILLDGMDARRSELRIRRSGHVLVLSTASEVKRGANVERDVFLSDLGEKIAEIVNGRLAAESGTVPPAYLAQLYDDHDVQIERFHDALRAHDYFACHEIVRRCTSDSYLSGRRLFQLFVLETERIAQGEYFLYELYSVRGTIEFSRKGPAKDATLALQSLMASLCQAAGADMSAAVPMLGDYNDATNRQAVTHFVRVHKALRHQRTFQLHRDFVAASQDVPQFAESTDRKFFDYHHPLTDFLRLALQRRHEELAVILQVLASDDYALLNRHLRHLQEVLENIPPSSAPTALLPDPIVEQGDSWPRLTFDAAPSLPLDEFCRCLALQLYGVLTGDSVVNKPGLWLSDTLVTYSGIDNYLASLWSATFQSLDAIRLVLSQIREDLLESLVQYKHQRRPEPSKIRDARLALTMRATRDISVLRKQKTSVLLVDDSVDTVRLLAIILERHGCTVSTAYDGKEALDVFRSAKQSIDVVVTDIRMPVMDGIELTRRIKREDLRVPVIVCSGVSDIDKNVKTAGADAAISKPFNADELIELILTTLAQRHPERYAEVGI